MDREELHRKIKLLEKKLQEGKIHIAAHLADGFRESLDKVRFLSDGLVDPNTVDGRIRAMCNFIAYQNDRDEWKEAVSLNKIQEAYFQRVEYAFGQLYDMMVKAKVDPYRFAGWFSSLEEQVNNAIPVFDEFIEELSAFWKDISEPTWIHLEDAFNSKAVFGGEVFPDGTSNLVSSTGLYFDTTILPDPFIKIAPLLTMMSKEEKCYELVRLALQVLSYKSLVLANTDRPIVAILPDRYHFDEGYKKFVTSCAESDALSHANHIFDKNLASLEDAHSFLREFSSAEQLVGNLKRPSELVFATEWGADPVKQLKRYISEEATKVGMKAPGDAVFMQLYSRFTQANDIYQRSMQLRGTPIIRAETSWLWYNWMLRYNSNTRLDGALKELHISRALSTTVKTEFTWLGNIPSDALIEIRKSGALAEIREILGKGIKEIIDATPDRFYRTGDQVFDNLQKAFSDHEHRLKELRSKKWSFAGKDIGSFMVVGGIEIAAAITGLPLYGVLASTAGMTGAIPTVKELKDKFKQLKAEEVSIRNTGVGMLFKHKK